MKKSVMMLLTLAGLQFNSQAQCDKNIKITSAKTEYVDSTGKVDRTEEEKSSIEITGQDIKIMHGEEDEAMTGKLKSVQCLWKTPYKDGKTVIRTDLSDKSGAIKTATITLEGKDGKLTALLVADDFPNKRIRLNMDSFEEKK